MGARTGRAWHRVTSSTSPSRSPRLRPSTAGAAHHWSPGRGSLRRDAARRNGRLPSLGRCGKLLAETAGMFLGRARAARRSTCRLILLVYNRVRCCHGHHQQRGVPQALRQADAADPASPLWAGYIGAGPAGSVLDDEVSARRSSPTTSARIWRMCVRGPVAASNTQAVYTGSEEAPMIVPMADRPHHRAHIAPVARLLGIDSLYMERAIAGPDDVALIASLRRSPIGATRRLPPHYPDAAWGGTVLRGG